MTNRLILAVIALSCVTLCAAEDHPPRIHKIKSHLTDGWFLDEAGRARLFHGVNMVNKGFPWYPKEVFNDTRLDDLRDWGLNVVRLGCMWSGAEPEEGVFNGTYIQVIRQSIQRLAAAGIYTMLDMHQDVLSSKYRQYDGVPRWLIDQFPEPSNPYPWPLDEVTQWEEGYLTQAVSEHFQCLYNDTVAAVQKWARFWGVIALNLRDEPGLLGYNLMNEPWIGDYFSDDSLTLPGVAGKQNLQPCYDVINEEIRKFDPNGIIFYEPVIYGVLSGSNQTIGSGFDKVPGGSAYRNVSSYSYHIYCWPLEFIADNATDDDRREGAEFCKEYLLPQVFEAQHDTTNTTGGSAILTEFGLCRTHEDEINIECETFMNLADQWLQSWVEWEYLNTGSWYDAEGNRILGKITHFVRPYPYAIAGVPTRIDFNSTTLTFLLEFTIDPTIAEPTVVFVPPLRYEDGYDYQHSANLRLEKNGSFVYLYHEATWGLSTDDPAYQLDASVRISPLNDNSDMY